MNAHAILTSHGWRGTGHTLHAHNDQIGIAKPLLVKHKKDNSGLGTSNIVSEQWWLSAIDEQLKGLDTTSGKPVQTVKTGMIGRLDRRVQRYSLYDSFVKGETLDSTIDKDKDKKPMAGSIGPSSLANEPKSKSKSNKSKKNNPLPTPPLSCSSAMLSSSTSTSISTSPLPPRNVTRDERRARKEAKQQRKIEKAAKKEAKLKRKEEKDMKRREKEEKRAKKQQRADEKSARRARKLAKRAET